ncbi:HlyD family efflux transporter periplasmic adaptor subunit [Nonomuraea bangladeshensis]|uniref:HlyD family efflux transporter periplasmic adaptor subunit n=1 Tax=Nonomuraea bangladeshensis TaxID=404385 RepID=UPI003C2C0E49
MFLPSKIRIAKADVAVGDTVSPGRRVFTVTGTDRLVHLDLDVADLALARKGAMVKVELPGGRTVAGKLVTVGAVVKSREGDATVDVGVRLAKLRSALADQTPISVLLESISRRNVLSVPVEALPATADGGYRVEIGGRVAGQDRRVWQRAVEISGPGLEAGMKAGVPAT